MGVKIDSKKTRAVKLRASEYRALNITFILVDAQYKICHLFVSRFSSSHANNSNATIS